MTQNQKQELIRVCFVAPKAYPLFNPDVKEYFGGAELDLYLLATELAKDTRFSVSFIVADYGQKNVENIHGVSIFKSLNLKNNAVRGTVRIWNAIKAVNAQIYVQEAASPGTFLIALFCKVNDKLFIYRTASERECNGTYIKQNPLICRLFAWALRHAAKVIVQNEKDADNITQTIGVQPIVIPNAHTLPEQPETTRDKILWVGRSTKVKRPDLFLKFTEQFPKENFVMICQRGTGDKDYDTLVAQARQIENLDFIGRVGFDKVDAYFQTAKVLVNTSDSEGFPNTFIQACMNATPILSLGVNPDNFLNKYKCGMCADNDWEKFVSQLKAMLKPEARDKYAVNARRYAEEKHNIRKIVEQYKNEISKLVCNT